MGRAADKEIVLQFGIYQDKALQLYINMIGQIKHSLVILKLIQSQTLLGCLQIIIICLFPVGGLIIVKAIQEEVQEMVRFLLLTQKNGRIWLSGKRGINPQDLIFPHVENF